ncbi:ester cyclase [Pollutibacter soli]|uniref:ester cyclase n=1 Tax=Pollutibacter soli TaxID=3034157 RepID=UPI0030135A69
MTNTEVVQTWFQEVWNNKNVSAIDKLMSPDCIPHGIPDENRKPIVGVSGFKKFYDGFLQSFPDIQIEIKDLIAEGDMVVTRCEARFTHTGTDFQTSANKKSSPDGRSYTFPGVSITRIKDGKIVEGWNHWDFLQLYMEMGAV